MNCLARLICSVRFAHNIALCGVGNWLKISSKQNWIFGTLLHFIANALVSLQYIEHYVSLSLSLSSLSLTLSRLNKHLVAGLCHGSSRIALCEHMTVGRPPSKLRIRERSLTVDWGSVWRSIVEDEVRWTWYKVVKDTTPTNLRVHTIKLQSTVACVYCSTTDTTA